MLLEKSFWQGKRVFVTQPHSFLGAWTALSLQYLGAQVFGYSDAAPSAPNLFDLSGLSQSIAMIYGDLLDVTELKQALDFAQADIVLHLGESGLLSEADKSPLSTIKKNVIGTATLLELLKETATVRAVVIASSDKVYSRSIDNVPFTEKDPIAQSNILPTAKLCAELIALSYRQTFFSPDKFNKHKIALATARLESAIGGADFSAGSLIPQAVDSFIKNQPFEVKNPNSVRPWIHVLDQVSGLLLLAQKLIEKGPKLSETYNLGAIEYESVGTVAEKFSAQWGKTWSSVKKDATSNAPSYHGRLNSELAFKDLGWKPQWSLDQSLADVARWYQDFYSGKSSSDQLTRSLRGYFSA